MNLLPNPTSQDWLTARAAATPDKLALVFGDRAWGYAALKSEVDVLVSRLWAAGARPGDHVGALLPNRPEVAFLAHALARLGAVWVPLNTRLTATELGYQAQVADCVLVSSW